jgi:hypothetical protein
MTNDFATLKQFIDESNLTNSTNEKVEVLKRYKDNEFIKNVLLYTYTRFNQYYVKASNLKKNYRLCSPFPIHTSLFTLLDDLDARSITGHDAVKEVNGFIANNKEYADIIYNIFDRNLKNRISTSLIERVFPNLIPTFDVALANKYNESLSKKIDFTKEKWFVSRKLDGCLTENTMIEFEDGKKIKIKEVVEKNLSGKIKSYNTKTKKIEYKEILNWMKNLSDVNSDNAEWYEITLENDKKITLTGNHRIWLPELKCWRRTDELNGNETILFE